MITVSFDNRQATLPEGSTALACLTALHQDLTGVLAVRTGGSVRGLLDPVCESCSPVPLTLQDEEGRRVYERTLRMVLFMAMERCFPGEKIRMEYSSGYGVIGRLEGRRLDTEDLDAVKAIMEEITEADLPILRQSPTDTDALRVLDEQGRPDGSWLLNSEVPDTFHLYRCGDTQEYFYGVIAPSTGYVRVFDLQKYNTGFVLIRPAPDTPDRPSAWQPSRKLQKVFNRSKRWCALLGMRNAPDLAGLMSTARMRNFIRVNEALQSNVLNDIAQEIVDGNRRVVLVAGPSSSGKTTFAGRLGVHLQVLGHPARRVSMDDYYLDRDKIPPEPDGHVDLEAITTLDLDLMQKQIRQLLAGEEVLLPRFNFQTGKQERTDTPVRLMDHEILILEGIHGLNPTLYASLPAKQIYRVFVSALTCLNLDDHNRIRTTDVRLLRRIVRDHLFRGTSPEETLAMWDSVRAGENKWIFPFQEQADYIFNTALHYELPVLKYHAYELLKAIPSDRPVSPLAHRLLTVLSLIPDPDPAVFTEIPPLSLLREFIGGCTMEEEG